MRRKKNRELLDGVRAFLEERSGKKGIKIPDVTKKIMPRDHNEYMLIRREVKTHNTRSVPN